MIEYCRCYQEEEKMQPIASDPTQADRIQPIWYVRYCEDLDEDAFCNMVACLAMGLQIRGKSPDELRQIFHLPDKPVVTDDVEIGS